MKNNIISELKKFTVDIDDLVFDPSNARVHDDKNLEAIRSSLAKFGQRSPIVVQKDGMVVRAGNGRLEAAKQLGWDKIAAVVVDDDNLTATAYAIADNRTGELASWDYGALEMLLGEISNVDIVGFDDADLKRIMNPDNNFNDGELSKELFNDFKNECPKCGFKFD